MTVHVYLTEPRRKILLARNFAHLFDFFEFRLKRSHTMRRYLTDRTARPKRPPSFNVDNKPRNARRNKLFPVAIDYLEITQRHKTLLTAWPGIYRHLLMPSYMTMYPNMTAGCNPHHAIFCKVVHAKAKKTGMFARDILQYVHQRKTAKQTIGPNFARTNNHLPGENNFCQSKILIKYLHRTPTHNSQPNGRNSRPNRYYLRCLFTREHLSP